MCDYCNADTEKSAKANDMHFAERLELLAIRYRDLAYGRVKPHTDENKRSAPLATNIIRKLVEDWI